VKNRKQAVFLHFLEKKRSKTAGFLPREEEPAEKGKKKKAGWIRSSAQAERKGESEKGSRSIFITGGGGGRGGNPTEKNESAAKKKKKLIFSYFLTSLGRAGRGKKGAVASVSTAGGGKTEKKKGRRPSLDSNFRGRKPKEKRGFFL